MRATSNLPRGCIKMNVVMLTALEFLSLALTLVGGPANASYVGPIGKRPRRRCLNWHEEYKECVSRHCPFDASCDTYGRECPSDCEGRASCLCKEGYVKQNDVCIPVNQCPMGSIICTRDNEVFRSCKSSLCPKGPTCEEPEKNCGGDCNGSPGCVCLPGYVWHKQRGCVKPKDCGELETSARGGKCQGQHEEIRCVTKHCPRGPTCARPSCKALSCEHRACACKLGYLRNHRGQCVRKTECLGKRSATAFPAKCERMNEIYSCTSDRCPHGAECGKPWCPGKCMKGACVCIPQYARDSKMNCIKEEHCDKQGHGRSERLWKEFVRNSSYPV